MSKWVGANLDQGCDPSWRTGLNVDQGRVTKTVSLPAVLDLQLVEDSIYASGSDGRLIRLDPVR